MGKITLISKKIVFTINLLFITVFGISQTSQTYSTSGTFTVPAGVTSIQVEAWGGGGKGGSKVSGNATYGGGGGGAYAKKAITVIPGTTYTVSVGIGSISQTTTAASDSWFDNNTLILAKGGNSVLDNSTTGATGGLFSSCIGDVRFSGGNGANGTTNGGGGGSSAGTALDGTTATNQNGAIAPSGGGNGSSGSSGSSTSNGLSPGGGGGGGKNNDDGASGGAGKIIITWSCPTYSLSTTAVTSPICATNSTNVSVTSSATDLPIAWGSSLAAPVLCWCAFTMLPSINCHSKSGSLTSDLKIFISLSFCRPAIKFLIN